MMFSAIDLVQPTTLDAATEALARPGAVALAGGTDLMNAVRLGHRTPVTVVDLTGLAELEEISDDPLSIGAGVSMRRFLAHDDLARRLPALADAATLLGGRQIQAAATFGGNICNASPAAETATPLLVLGAELRVVGPSGTRVVALPQLWSGPGTTVLSSGEIVVSFGLPDGLDGSRSAYRRIELRRSVDIALVNAAVWCDVDDGVVVSARVAIGAVSPVPLLVDDAGQALVGLEVADAAARTTRIEAAAAASQAASRPISDIRAGAEYRRAMVAEVVRRAASAALSRPLDPPSTSR